jgi:uncharacterized protein YjiS (DUF1127 family)
MTIVLECSTAHSAPGFWQRARRAFAAWPRRARTRQHLREFDAEQLVDIGLSEAERRRECAKWFWQK